MRSLLKWIREYRLKRQFAAAIQKRIDNGTFVKVIDAETGSPKLVTRDELSDFDRYGVTDYREKEISDNC